MIIDKLTDQERSVLQRIQDSVPQELYDNLIIKQDAFPELKIMYENGMKDPDITDEQRRKLEFLKSSGYVDMQEDRVNEKVAKQIDDYITKEMKSAMKVGLLPKKNIKRFKKQLNGQKENNKRA